MIETVYTWAKVRKEAARVVDKAGEIQRIVEWSDERVRDESEALAEMFTLKGSAEGLAMLLETCLMRQQLRMSEELSEELQFALVNIMWVHEWTADEVKDALKKVFSRLHVVPSLPAEGIKVLLDVASLYRGLKQRDRWPNRETRVKCAELMWLMHIDEDAVLKETHAAMERLNMGRGDEGKAIDALREMELIYRRIQNDVVSRPQARKFAEIMWLRGWALDDARGEAAALQARLDLPSETKSVAVLLEICLLCGGKDRPNRVYEAAERIWEEEAGLDEVMDRRLTKLGEYMWLERYTLPQVLDKVGRFARVNHVSLGTTLDVLSMLSHERCHAQEKPSQPWAS